MAREFTAETPRVVRLAHRVFPFFIYYSVGVVVGMILRFLNI